MVAFFFPMQHGGASFSVSFLGSNASTSAGSSQSFAGESLGTAASSREIFVAVSWIAGSVARTLSSGTIGGVSATIRVQDGLSDGFGHSLGAAVISAAVPTGATGTISLSFSGSVDACAIGKYRVLNRTSIFHTASNTASNGSPATNSVSINVGSGGAIIAAYQLYDAASDQGGPTWGNITKNYGTPFFGNNHYYSGASQYGLSAQTGRSITTSAVTAGLAGTALAVVSIT
jgi:hypothetical protein